MQFINHSKITPSLSFYMHVVQIICLVYTMYLLDQKKNTPSKLVDPVDLRTANPIDLPSVKTPRETIRNIMSRTGTDKVSRHAYDRYYDFYLEKFRDKEDLMILEIGADSGQSLLLWSEYFSKTARIHGISYGVDEKASKQLVCNSNPEMCKNIEIFNGDQGDTKFLETLRQKYMYDIIVDDGSHLPAHQIITLQYLFSALKPGGLYVIEDLETSYWDVPNTLLYGYGISAGIGASPQVSAVEKLKQYIDVIMRYDMGYPKLSISNEDDKFFSITFGEGLAIIRKSTYDDENHHPNIPSAPVVHSNIDQWESRAKESNPTVA